MARTNQVTRQQAAVTYVYIRSHLASSVVFCRCWALSTAHNRWAYKPQAYPSSAALCLTQTAAPL